MNLAAQHCLEVVGGCRLHFGLMELCANEPNRFGGLGLMLSQPGFRLRIRTVDAGPKAYLDSVENARVILPESVPDRDDLIARVHTVVQRRREAWRPTSRVNSAASRSFVQIEVLHALPFHCGLGSGTQLATAVAAGLELFSRGQSATDLDIGSIAIGEWQTCTQGLAAGLQGDVPNEAGDFVERQSALQSWLVSRSGRGLRSAIGLQGFLQGGLVLDQGYEPAGGEHREVSAESIKLPQPWRVVTILPPRSSTVSGRHEAKLLDEIGRRPNPHRERMLQLALGIQAAVASVEVHSDSNLKLFETVTGHIEAYMSLAAAIFRDVQGGQFNGAEVANAALAAKEAGLRAVGQSSWGPVIFGFAGKPADAESAVAVLRNDLRVRGCEVRICEPAVEGAKFRWIKLPN